MSPSAAFFMRDVGAAMRNFAALTTGGNSNLSPTYSNIRVTGVVAQQGLPAAYATVQIPPGTTIISDNTAGTPALTSLSNYSLVVDNASAFDAARGTFTAPLTGIYQLSFGGNVTALQDGLQDGELTLRNSNTDATLGKVHVNAFVTTESISTTSANMGMLQAGDVVYMAASNIALLESPPPFMHVHMLTPV